MQCKKNENIRPMKLMDDNARQMHMSELPSGIYFVTILTNENETVVRKVIKIQ